jgi:hypothetical protein
MGATDRDSVRFTVQSSLGRGVGISDGLFRGAVFEFGVLGANRFASFITYRIAQQYGSSGVSFARRSPLSSAGLAGQMPVVEFDDTRSTLRARSVRHPTNACDRHHQWSRGVLMREADRGVTGKRMAPDAASEDTDIHRSAGVPFPDEFARVPGWAPAAPALG